MPNVMAAQPNIGGALCESSVIPFLVPRRKVRLTPAAGVPCSNAANIGERKTYTEGSYTEACSVPSRRGPAYSGPMHWGLFMDSPIALAHGWEEFG